MSEERSREFESFDEPASNLPLLDKLDASSLHFRPAIQIRRDCARSSDRCVGSRK